MSYTCAAGCGAAFTADWLLREYPGKTISELPCPRCFHRAPGLVLEGERLPTKETNQLPFDALRMIQDFEDAVVAKSKMDHAGVATKHYQEVLDEYTEAKKAVLNVLREMYGLEQLP